MNETDYPECIDCKRPMRSSRRRLAECPGTVPSHSHGRCQMCAKRAKSGHTGFQKKPRPDVDVTATIQSLTSYLEWRRPYRDRAGAL